MNMNIFGNCLGTLFQEGLNRCIKRVSGISGAWGQGCVREMGESIRPDRKQINQKTKEI